jgi:hypothetical protein
MSAVLSMTYRSMLDPLRSSEWKNVATFRTSISARALNQIITSGWVEIRGGGKTVEIRITPFGLKALTAPVPIIRD